MDIAAKRLKDQGEELKSFVSNYKKNLFAAVSQVRLTAADIRAIPTLTLKRYRFSFTFEDPY